MPRILLTITALLSAIAVATGCGNSGSSASGAASLAPAGAAHLRRGHARPERRPAGRDRRADREVPRRGQRGRAHPRAAGEGVQRVGHRALVRRGHRAVAGRPGRLLRLVVQAGRTRARALLVATDDEDKAKRRDREGGQGDDGKDASYKGHDYRAFSGGAAGVVDGWVVLGSESAFKAAVDTAEGGKPIEDDDPYTKALADAPEDRLGFVYVNTPAFVKQLPKTAPGRLGRSRTSSRTRCWRPSTPPSRACVSRRRCRVAQLRVPVPGSGRRARRRPAGRLVAGVRGSPTSARRSQLILVSSRRRAAAAATLTQQLEAATGLDLDKDVSVLDGRLPACSCAGRAWPS